MPTGPGPLDGRRLCPVEVTLDSWWGTLSHDRREVVIGTVYEDDMAVGQVFAEMRHLGLIQSGQARRTAEATGLRRICWPRSLAADVLRLDAAEAS